jgi:hypothetical protein
MCVVRSPTMRQDTQKKKYQIVQRSKFLLSPTWKFGLRHHGSIKTITTTTYRHIIMGLQDIHLSILESTLLLHLAPSQDLGSLMCTCRSFAHCVSSCRPVLEQLTRTGIRAAFVSSLGRMFGPSRSIAVPTSPLLQAAVQQQSSTEVHRGREVVVLWNAGIAESQRRERVVSSLVLSLAMPKYGSSELDGGGCDRILVILQIGSWNALVLRRLEWELLSGASSEVDLTMFFEALVLPQFQDVSVHIGWGCEACIEMTSHPLPPSLPPPPWQITRSDTDEQEEVLFFEVRTMKRSRDWRRYVLRNFDARSVVTRLRCDFDSQPHGVFVVTQLREEFRPDLLTQVRIWVTWMDSREAGAGLRRKEEEVVLGRDELRAFRIGEGVDSRWTGVELPRQIRGCHFLPMQEMVSFSREDFEMHLTLTHSMSEEDVGIRPDISLIAIASHSKVYAFAGFLTLTVGV